MAPKLKITSKQLKEFTGNGLLSQLFTLIGILDKIHDKFDAKRHTDRIKMGKSITIPISKTLIGKVHEGGFLPALLPFIPYIIAGIGTAGAVTGGISTAINAANNAKKNQEELVEMKRHNLTMESKGTGLKKTKKSSR